MSVRANALRWPLTALGGAALVCLTAAPAHADGYRVRGPIGYGDGVSWTLDVNVVSATTTVTGDGNNTNAGSPASWSAANFALYQCASTGGSCSVIAQTASSNTWQVFESHSSLSHGHTYESCLSVHPDAAGSSFFASPNTNSLCSPYDPYS